MRTLHPLANLIELWVDSLSAFRCMKIAIRIISSGGYTQMHKPVISIVFVLLLICGSTEMLSGQHSAEPTRGVVSGRVIDAETERPLPGANIVIQGTMRGAASNEHGRFIIRGVEPGIHTVRVTYVGYQRAEKEIELRSGERVTLEFALLNDFIEGWDVEVVGVLEGQARAFNRQRSADNLKHIVSAEQLQRFEDAGIAGALRRIPGIAFELDRGDPGPIMIRGLNPQLAIVSIDGHRLASTNRDNREVNLVGVNTELVSEIEVIKAITPDMDADAVSGAVNLITRRPLGNRRTFQITAAGGYNQLADNFNYHGSVIYGQRLGNMGFSITTNYRNDRSSTHDIRHDFGIADFGTGPVDVLAGLRPSLYTMERQRFSLSGHTDYYLTQRSVLFLRGMYNYYSDHQERHDVRHRIDDGTYTSPTSATRGRIDRESRIYNRQLYLMSVSAGAEHAFDTFNLEYDVAYSVGGFDEPDRDYYVWRAGRFDYDFDISNRKFGAYQITNASDLNPYDPAHYAFRYFERRITNTTERDLTGRIDVTVPVRLAHNHASVKTGAKFSFKTKDGDHARHRYTSFAGSLTLADLATNRSKNIVRNQYFLGPHVDWKKGREFFERNKNLFTEDFNRTREQSDPNRYTAQEDILAGYSMLTVDIGQLRFIAGIRLEYTQTNYTGNEVFFDAEGNHLETRKSEASGNYLNAFPMFHIRYSLNPMTNIRFAYTNTIARPPYEELSPYRLVSFADERITRGNPELKPSLAQSFDLMLEHFLGNVGILSAGVFYKDIRDFVYTQSYTLEGGEFDGWEERMPQNGEDAWLFGFEVAWQQNLNFLPGMLSGLGIYANYTYLTSRATITPRQRPRGTTITDELYERNMALPLMVPHILNLALSYQFGGFFAQVSYNYQHATLYSLGGSTSAPTLAQRGKEFLDRYMGNYGQLDVTISQRVSSHVRVFMEAKNITNASDNHYFAHPDYPYRDSYHGWWGNFGVRVHL